MDLTIRPARPDEFDAVGALTVRAFATIEGFDADNDEYTEVLADVAGRAKTCEIIVAVESAGTGRILGAVTYVPGPGPFAEFTDTDAAGLRMLAVEADAAGRGIGSALTRVCCDRAAAQGRARLVLHTSHRNRVAQRLYPRLGFRRTPERDLSLPSGLQLHGFEFRTVDALAGQVTGRPAPSERAAPEVEVATVAPDHPVVADMVDELLRELSLRYGPSDGEGDPFRPADVGPSGAVLLARLDGEPVGTVTLRPREGKEAEIKRMYVSEHVRGRGVGAALLTTLEQIARKRGYGRVVLETGIRQPEATGMYLAAGYTPIAPYGWYRNEPGSRCFAKDLAES